jgi:hypothetical protein
LPFHIADVLVFFKLFLMVFNNIYLFTFHFSAICDGKIDINTPGGACNVYYGGINFQLTRDKGVVRDSGGTCSSPDGCTNCDTDHGFYSVGPRCESKYFLGKPRKIIRNSSFNI